MYIHNYQIHNVLDIYRKQLSQGANGGSGYPNKGATPAEGVASSGNRPRQAIIDQVSADIVAQIVGNEPRSRFADVLANTYNKPSSPQSQKTEVRFTYSTIDENDQKIINSLPLGRITPLLSGGPSGETGQLAGNVSASTDNGS